MTNEERERLVKVESSNEELRRVIQEIRDDQKSIIVKVDRLTADANRGKGALAVIVSASGLLGAFVGFLVSHITFH